MMFLRPQFCFCNKTPMPCEADHFTAGPFLVDRFIDIVKTLMKDMEEDIRKMILIERIGHEKITTLL